MIPDLIVGVGSPHGDDAVGWRIVERLSPHIGRSTRSLTLSEPTQILFHLVGCRRLWIIDACRSGLPQGSVVRMRWPDERLDTCTAGSSHAFGLRNILHLAQTLGTLPEEVVIYAVEIGTAVFPESPISPEVALAGPEVERMLLQELSALRKVDGSATQ